MKAVVKPQYVDQIPKAVKGPNKEVGELMKERCQMPNLDEILDVLGKDILSMHLTAGILISKQSFGKF